MSLEEAQIAPQAGQESLCPFPSLGCLHRPLDYFQSPFQGLKIPTGLNGLSDFCLPRFTHCFQLASDLSSRLNRSTIELKYS